MNNLPSTPPVFPSQADHTNENSFVLYIKEEISDDQSSASDNETMDEMSMKIEEAELLQMEDTYTKLDSVNLDTQTKNCFICDICKEMFHKKIHLQRHLTDNSSNKVQSNKIFPHSTLQMKTHAKEKPFTCEVCHKKFRRHETLRVHSRIHTGATFPCTWCDKTFTQKSNLLIHIRVHTGDKPFACDQCDLTFARKFYLERHTSSHTGQKPFTCEYCDKTFSRNYYLKRHLSIHTGYKPFECKQCDKSFYRNDHLQNHIVSVHLVTKPFVCEHCNKAFSRNDHLHNHVKFKHLC